MAAPAMSPTTGRLSAAEQRRIRELLTFIVTELPPVSGIHISTLRRSLAPHSAAMDLKVFIELRVLPFDVPIGTYAGGLTSGEGRTAIPHESVSEHIRNAQQLLTTFTSSIPERDPHGAYYVVRAVELDALRDRLERALQAAEFGREQAR